MFTVVGLCTGPVWSVLWTEEGHHGETSEWLPTYQVCWCFTVCQYTGWEFPAQVVTCLGISHLSHRV